MASPIDRFREARAAGLRPSVDARTVHEQATSWPISTPATATTTTTETTRR